jgi:hypothetical protein
VLTKPLDHGGLNLGTIGSSIVLASILIVFVVYTAIKHQDVANKDEALATRTECDSRMQEAGAEIGRNPFAGALSLSIRR